MLSEKSGQSRDQEPPSVRWPLSASKTLRCSSAAAFAKRRAARAWLTEPSKQQQRKLESELEFLVDRCPKLLPKRRPLALGRGHVTAAIGHATPTATLGTRAEQNFPRDLQMVTDRVSNPCKKVVGTRKKCGFL